MDTDHETPGNVPDEMAKPPQPHPKKRSRPWLMAFVMMSLVFAFGVVVGSVVTGQTLRHRMEQRFKEPGAFVDHVLQRLRDELALTGAQADQIRAIMEAHQERIHKLHAEFRPKMEEAFEALRGEVSAVLSPEQAEKWSKRFDEERQHWLRPPGAGFGRGMGPRGWRGGGPPEARFEEVDANKDGTVAWDEFHEARPRAPKERFTQLDANADGKVTKEEFEQANGR